MKKEKEVEISKLNCKGEDEVYEEWYSCPLCDDGWITRRAKYCSNCGVKLIWKSDE